MPHVENAFPENDCGGFKGGRASNTLYELNGGRVNRKIEGGGAMDRISRQVTEQLDDDPVLWKW